MDKCLIDIDGSLMSNQNAAEVLQPRIGSFDDPTTFVSAQFSTILICRPGVVGTFRNNGIDMPMTQKRTHRIRVVASIADQPLGRPAAYGFQRRFQQLHFRGRRRVQVKSDRSTLAINQYHKLRSLPALCFSDTEPPFLAEANVPSTKHSFQRICCLSESWVTNACQVFSKVPSSVHFRRRRYTLLKWPYRSGNSLQGAPVQRIQRTPSKHFRSSVAGRPPLRSFLRHGFLRTGKCFWTSAHWASDNCLQANSFAPFADEITTGHGRKNKTYENLCREVSI